MKLLSLKVLRGPNYWSNYRKKLIELEIDLGQFEKQPSHLIPKFNDQLKQLIPSLYEHSCSFNYPGGFFKRLEKGTWLGHVLEHVALELQCLAGMKCVFGRTYSGENDGEYYVVFEYAFEKAGVYSAHAAFNIVSELAHQHFYQNLDKDILKLKKIFEDQKLGPSLQSIVQELKKRSFYYRYYEDEGVLAIGQGKHQKYMLATESSETSIVGVEIASNKDVTKKLLRKHAVPVPEGIIVSSVLEVEEALEHFVLPAVVKPLNANHGKGVSCNLKSREEILYAFELAKTLSDKVIIERFIKGLDYRFLVINYKVVAVARRYPATVIGDGISTIKELIDTINKHPKRSSGHGNFLSAIEIDLPTLSILHAKGYSLDTVLPACETLVLKHAANISSGGTAEDVTDIVHPETIFLAERVARLLNLNICGIDMILQDVKIPLKPNTGAIIEVNSGPGFRMHLSPDIGPSRDVAKAVVDMLYPKNMNPRIPVIAVTGTNGKTTVVRMLAYIAKAMGFKVGFTTTEGVYIDNHKIYNGDASGPKSAELVLRDTLVDFAILECARGGILREGLGFDHCDISIVTNITEDHLGLGGIHTLKQLKKVKAVVPFSTFEKGYAILNADNELVYSIKNELSCHVALFSLQKTNSIKDHLASGGIAAYIENDTIVVAQGKVIKNYGCILDMPITLNGQLVSMIKNILPVVLACHLSQFDIQLIKNALLTFKANVKHLPGRMNHFIIRNTKILLDYAHNLDAYLDLKTYLSAMKGMHKVGLIAATGDRRAIDIINIGESAADIFDEIIIRHDKDGRGRTNDELTELLMLGIKKIDKTIKVSVISDEQKALQYILERKLKNQFLFYFPDNVSDAIDHLNALMQQSTLVEEMIDET